MEPKSWSQTINFRTYQKVWASKHTIKGFQWQTVLASKYAFLLLKMTGKLPLNTRSNSAHQYLSVCMWVLDLWQVSVLVSALSLLYNYISHSTLIYPRRRWRRKQKWAPILLSIFSVLSLLFFTQACIMK